MQLSGSITALATPFTPLGSLDLMAWQRLIEGQLEAGSAAVVVAGSTGEASALSDAEYVVLLERAVEWAAGRIPVIAGTGLSNTDKTIAQTRLAKSCGAHAALVVTPPYVRPTQDGLLAHYQAVAEQGGLPVVLYNVPGRTGCDLLPETVAQLCGHPDIIGLKEARGDEARWSQLYPLRAPGFSLLSGDDPTFARAIRNGADGVVSVASNLVPRAFARICRDLQAGHVDEALALDASLQGLYDFLGVEPNPIPVKALLCLMGIGHGLRLPLLTLSHTHVSAARHYVELCQRIEADLS